MTIRQLANKIAEEQRTKKRIYLKEQDPDQRIYLIAQINAYTDILDLIEYEIDKAAEKADKENQ